MSTPLSKNSVHRILRLISIFLTLPKLPKRFFRILFKFHGCNPRWII